MFGNTVLDMSGKKSATFLKTSKSAVSESINRGEILAAKFGITVTVLPNHVPATRRRREAEQKEEK